MDDASSLVRADHAACPWSGTRAEAKAPRLQGRLAGGAPDRTSRHSVIGRIGDDRSLDRLLAAVRALDAGDMVVAWEPLATGLEAKQEFKRIAEFRCWLSLYCHKRWQKGALRPLKRQFKELFVSEWIYCRRNRDWATECLAVALKALEYFAASSGLRSTR